MRNVRPLLTLGNGKLGASIFHFDLPAAVTCPGKSGICEQVCYARKGHFVFPQVRERLRWNHEQSIRAGFAGRMAEEIRRKGVLVVRLHVSGDLYNAEYAGKWLQVMQSCPHVRFFGYTRSWRVPDIEPVLRQMAELKNVRLWYSADRDTGEPPDVPEGVRVAWLQDGEEGPVLSDLVFRVQKLRREPRQRIGLAVICPHETPAGKERGVNCGSCGHCWR